MDPAFVCYTLLWDYKDVRLVSHKKGPKTLNHQGSYRDTTCKDWSSIQLVLDLMTGRACYAFQALAELIV